MKLDLIRKEVENSDVVMRGSYPYVIFPLVTGSSPMDSGALKEAIDALCEIGEYDCDMIIAPEAMGILYGAAVSVRKGIPLVIMRKHGTAPENEVVIRSTTGYSENVFHLPKLKRGTRVAMVDDIISTGGTAKALVKALMEMGVTVTEVVCLINKSVDVKALEREIDVPVRTVATITVKDGKARLLE